MLPPPGQQRPEQPRNDLSYNLRGQLCQLSVVVSLAEAGLHVVYGGTELAVVVLLPAVGPLVVHRARPKEGGKVEAELAGRGLGRLVQPPRDSEELQGRGQLFGEVPEAGDDEGGRGVVLVGTLGDRGLDVVGDMGGEGCL